MLDNLSPRSTTLAVAAVPVNALAMVALWALAVGGQPALGLAAAAAAAATMGVAVVLGRRITTTVEDGLERQRADLTEANDRAVAEQRIALGQGLFDLIGGVSGRSRQLLDAQIDHIDWLEATEEDPDRLEHLFALDHLANRLRRSCESIMVLAGSDGIERRSTPASVADIVRVAMGENEHFRRLTLTTLDDAMIAADSACDIAHLLSELLDNATKFSDPDELVEIHATELSDGTYRVTIIDRGPGMSEDELASANALLVDPPDIDLTLGRSRGLAVIARLADRLDATTVLSSNGAGITAEVILPSSAVASSVAATPTVDAAPRSEVAPTGSWTPPPVTARAEPDEEADEDGQISTLAEALGSIDDFTTQVENLLEAEAEAEDTEPGTEIGAEAEDDESWTPPTPAPEPVLGGGLTRRQRGTGPKPGGSGQPAAKASSRKPEEVRSMITKYRDGLKAKQSPADRSSADETPAS